VSDECYEQKRKEINRLTLLLRTSYYDEHKNESEVYQRPHGGKMTESIGAWPEYILKGTFCKRSFRGLCSPCFYSRLPIAKHEKRDYMAMVRQQCMFIVDHFKNEVIDKQIGKTHIESPRFSEEPCSLVLTPTGSFFDDTEFPVELRIEVLEKMVDCSHDLKRDIVLHIESHAEDVLSYDFESETSKHELELLRQLNSKVILGFESSDEYMRNVLYNKCLKIDDFVLAVSKLQNIGLSVGAFVFAGLLSANDMQTKDDVLKSIEFLWEHAVYPVMMFQNLQEYTITDMFYQNGTINLLEPFTVLDIVSEFLKRLPLPNLYWLIADPIGGPPKPKDNIFACAKITCSSCSEKIYNSLVDLRTRRDISRFLLESSSIKKCECYTTYIKAMQTQSTAFTELVLKTEQLLSVAASLLPNYLHSIIRRKS